MSSRCLQPTIGKDRSQLRKQRFLQLKLKKIGSNRRFALECLKDLDMDNFHMTTKDPQIWDDNKLAQVKNAFDWPCKTGLGIMRPRTWRRIRRLSHSSWNLGVLWGNVVRNGVDYNDVNKNVEATWKSTFYTSFL